MVTNDSWNLDLSKEWLLPQKLVIKPQPDDPEYNDEFEMEGEVYAKLPHLQGDLIPTYHGIARFHHEGVTVRAHVIGQADGTPINQYTEDIWIAFGLRSAITEAYRRLSQEGVIHGDVESRHIFAGGPQQRLVLIDFGLAEFEDKERACDRNTADVRALFRKRDL